MAATPVAVQSSPFRVILRRIQEVLSLRLNIPIERIPMIKWSKYYVDVIGEFHLQLRPSGTLVLSDGGAGRYGTLASRVVAVDICIRSGIDLTGEDEIALTELDYGLFDLEEAVHNALTLRPLMSDDTPAATQLTVEPLHVAQMQEPPDGSEEDRGLGYLTSTIYFECKYVLPVQASAFPLSA